MRKLLRAGAAVACVREFAMFVRFTWFINEPTAPLEWNWHHQTICDAVQKQVEGDPAYRKLLIEVPPGTMKSLIVSVMRPAWIWLREGGRRTLYFSGSDDVVTRDSLRTRYIVTHDVYQNVLLPVATMMGYHGEAAKTAALRGDYTPPWELADDQNEKRNFHTSTHGTRECAAIGAKFTGRRADDIVLDDLVDVDETRGDPTAVARRMAEVNWIIQNKVKSRVNNEKTATWTLIQQGLAPGDPADVAAQSGDWHHIRIPMEFDPDEPRCPGDPRTVKGELLQPSRLGPEQIRAKKEGPEAMDPLQYEAQYNQRRIAATGGLYTPETFAECPQHHHTADADLDEVFDEIGMSVDCTFKKTADTDRVAIQVWGRIGWGRRVLLARETKRRTFMETLADMSRLHKTWGPSVTLVEDTANGPAAIEAMQDEIPGLIAVQPVDSKYARQQVYVAPLYRAGQIELPVIGVAPWRPDFERVHVAFRAGGTDDDDLDAESQMMAHWTRQAKQAPWIDAERVAVVVDEPAWASPEGGAEHYVHTVSALRAPLSSAWVGIVPPTPGAPEAGHIGVAVVITADGDVVGHVEAARTDTLASRLGDLCRSLFSRGGVVDATDWRRRVRCRLVGVKGPAVETMERALFDYRIPVSSVSQAATAWRPTEEVLAAAASLGRDLVSSDRFRVLDKRVLDIVQKATIHGAVPTTPRIRLVEHRWMRRPVNADAMLVALLAALDPVATDIQRQARTLARESDRPKTDRERVIERHRALYGTPVSGPAPTVWTRPW